ncbi:MAG: RNA polymerase sigma factor [Actinomycetota bacterium]|nr:RNA polymerase sigma factor [Actinomycetota bacterium]
MTTGADTPFHREDDASIPALVAAAQNGDAIAMNDLLDLLQPRVSRLCGSIALADGPDAAQEALIAIFRAIGQLRQPEALFGWARAIAVREAIRVARRTDRVVAAPLYEVPASGDPQLAVDLDDVLGRLSPEHRAVLVLRDIEGLDQRQAAALLDVEEGTVRSRLFRARERFRQQWGR